MALTEESGGGIPATMLVGPTGYQNGGGFGNGFGGDWAWIILLLVLFGGGNWGGNGGGFGGGGLYPWMNQAEITSNGFQNAATNSAISSLQNSVTAGFGDVQNALCNGFAGVANGFAQAEIAENARQMASMNQMFGLSTQFANCCCENRLGLANLGADIAREACADRAAVTDGVRDIIANQTQGIQTILTQMCNDKIDAKNERIADLERQLTMANLAASQNAQTAAILANNEAQTTALEQYLAPVPRPAYIVQNPNCCSPMSGCGCGSF